MFCNHCGAPLQPDYRVCPRCGKALCAGAPTSPSRLEPHLRTLGILWMIVGALTLVPALLLMLLSSVVHIAIPFSDALARELGPLVLMIVAAGFLIVGAGGLLVGWGLIGHQPWARIAAIVVGVLSLVHPPLGTILGIYTLWVLLSRNAELEYRRLARAA
jgi:zinc-ribbon domain